MRLDVFSCILLIYGGAHEKYIISRTTRALGWFEEQVYTVVALVRAPSMLPLSILGETRGSLKRSSSAQGIYLSELVRM